MPSILHAWPVFTNVSIAVIFFTYAPVSRFG